MVNIDISLYHHFCFNTIECLLLFIVIVMTNQTVNKFRSTVVHSNTIPAKEPHIIAFKDRQIAEESCSRSSRDTDGIPGNLSRSLQASQRIPMGTLSMLIVPSELSFPKKRITLFILMGVLFVSYIHKVKDKFVLLFSQTRKGCGAIGTTREWKCH